MHFAKTKEPGCLTSGMMLLLLLFLSTRYGGCQATDPDEEDTSVAGFSWGAESDFSSKYLWRGISINEGLVIQPNLFASFGNLSAGIWGNLVAFDRNGNQKRNEFDLIVTYSYSIGKLQVENTVMAYFYPGLKDDPPTCELYAGIGYPLGNFTLVSSVAADFVSYAGSLYFEHGLDYNLEITNNLFLDASLHFTWGNRKYFDSYVGTNRLSSNMVAAAVDLTYKPGGPVYYKPHFQLGRTTDREVSAYLSKFPGYFGLLIGFEL